MRNGVCRLRDVHLLASGERDRAAGPVRDGTGHALAFRRAEERLAGAALPSPDLPPSFALLAFAAATLARSVSVRSAGPPGFSAEMPAAGLTSSLPSILACPSDS